MGKVKTVDPEKQAQLEAEKAAKEAERLAKIEAARALGQRKEATVLSEVEGKQTKETTQEATEEKAAEESAPSEVSEPKEKKKVSKYAAKQKSKTRQRSENYQKAAAMVDKSKLYPVKDAIELLEKTHLAKFDESVELHINTASAGLSGQVTLPHGTGKSVRVSIIAPSKDAKAADDLLKEIESGKINFDILIATPDAMPKLARVAKVLGPRGLMPNPKNGTISANPEAAAKAYEGGQMYYKTEAKTPVMHVVVGKLSFGPEKLSENVSAMLKAVKSENIRNVTLKSTMSPAVRLLVK